MKNKNICKFVIDSSDDKLITNHFVYETDYETMSTPDKLKQHRVILIESGNGVFHFDDFSVNFSAGDLIFAFQNETFYTEISKQCEYMYISFNGTRSDTLFHCFGINKNNRKFPGFDGVIPLWKESLSRASQSNIDLASEGILLYTLSRLTAFDSSSNNIINEIIEITEAQFNNPELSVSTISKILSYNPKYISHIFKQHMGVGYTEYLRNFRIKYAVSLFDHGIDSVKNIAFLSGFRDPLYFSTVFKKITGVSPKEYKTKNVKK